MDSRQLLRSYYDKAADHYLHRASRGVMGWLRRKELAITLDMIPPHGSGRALDAGCGPGFYSCVMRERGFDVCAVDLSPEMVKKVKELGFTACVMDIERSCPPEELSPPFDFVFCAGVLEFAEDVRRFLGSLRSMTADGGEVLAVAPMKGFFGGIYKAYLQARGIPCRLYTERALASDLRASGFEPVEIRKSRPICLAIRARAVR